MVISKFSWESTSQTKVALRSKEVLSPDRRPIRILFWLAQLQPKVSDLSLIYCTRPSTMVNKHFSHLELLTFRFSVVAPSGRPCKTLKSDGNEIKKQIKLLVNGTCPCFSVVTLVVFAWSCATEPGKKLCVYPASLAGSQSPLTYHFRRRRGRPGGSFRGNWEYMGRGGPAIQYCCLSRRKQANEC